MAKQKITKKFIATAARQRLDSPGYYEAVNNPTLSYPVDNSFPILAAMNGYVKAGDDVELIIVRMNPDDEQGRETARLNTENMKSACKALCEEKSAASFTATDFIVKDDEQIDTHLDMFEKLIGMIHSGDSVFFDVTYGTKTQMLALVMAINYAYQAVPGADVGCVVYGNYNFQTKVKKMYDITSLFLMNQIVNKLGESRHPNPSDIIRQLIHSECEEQ